MMRVAFRFATSLKGGIRGREHRCLFHNFTRNQTKVPVASMMRRFSTVNQLDSQSGMILGILRETYNPWERRAPLCPTHVEHLLQRFRTGSNPPLLAGILVQPSSRRIFKDEEYQSAGAVLQDDLSRADLILGVKRPLSTEFLYPDKAYMFFSHVIKGQPENMPLLQHILDNRIQLFDYECIVEGGMQQTSNSRESKKKRVVAFGRFAGVAGTTDVFQVLGSRLLSQGFSTPFLNCPPAHMHYDWNDLRDCVSVMGQRIAQEGLPSDMGPIIFCFTGKGGNVCRGAMDVFNLLPHKIISVDELPRLHNQTGYHNCVYGLFLGTKDIFRRKDGQHTQFDRNDYQEHPMDYESSFSERVAPFITVLVNGMYWDERFPRMLTKDQMQTLYAKGHKSLMIVADISCDRNGSIEFLERTTTIDSPYFQYDPILQKEVSGTMSNNGVTVMGVDILPTELPRESSAYFGDALLPLIKKYTSSRGLSGPNDSNSMSAEAANTLPPELTNSCIADGGALTPQFRYIESFMNRTAIKSTPVGASILLWMEGHLFDSGLINHALDVIDRNGCNFEIVECTFRPKTDETPMKSSTVLRISAQDINVLKQVETKIQSLIDTIEKAEASMKRIDVATHDTASKPTVSVTRMPAEQRILILGSGRVSTSLAEYLGRDARRSILVASADGDEARVVSRAAKNGRHVILDVLSDRTHMVELIQDADIVVSLLPASMHSLVAEDCIRHSTNFVTASYESNDMRALDMRAKAAGVAILNEVGLDPGLDHMSAMRIIDDVHERGGTVTSFSSVCGGLPSPEAANNILMYKFSWSPMGVLSACQNDATFRRNRKTIKIDGKRLLQAAQPFLDAWPTLQLECLPNRDSLRYGDKYGIGTPDSLFRGTLRYRGFSKVMDVFQTMGLFEARNDGGLTWNHVLAGLRERKGSFNSVDDFLLVCAKGDTAVADKAGACLEALGMIGDGHVSNPDSVIHSFGDALERNCQYQGDERDMVLMHTHIQASFSDGTCEDHQSSLQAFGDTTFSAMSKTVGYTAGAATELLLDSAPSEHRGVLLPTDKVFYQPILGALEQEGIKFSETVKVHDSKKNTLTG